MSNDTVLVHDKVLQKFSEIIFVIENGFRIITFVSGNSVTLTESEFNNRFTIVENCAR